MPAAVEAVAPIFLLVAFGALAANRGVVDGRTAAALSSFAAKIGIPVLIFETLLHADLAGMSPWTLWGCYFPAAAIAWVLGHVLVLKLFHEDPRVSVIGGVGAAFANTAFVGLPLAERVYGPHGVVIVTILITVHMPVMLSAATLLMERAERMNGAPTRTPPLRLVGRILANLAHNPIVVGIAVAMVVRFSGYALPKPVDFAFSSLARAAGPVALFALGASLGGDGLRHDVGATLAVSSIKLVVMPALVLVAGLLAGLDAATLGPLVILAGVPSGVNVHLIAVQYGVGQTLGAGVVVATTVLGAVTSTAWLAWLG